MSPEMVALVQAGTALTAAATAVINLVMLFKRQKDSGMQVIKSQSGALDRSNKRLNESLDKVNDQVVTRLASIDSRLSHVQAVVDKIS